MLVINTNLPAQFTRRHATSAQEAAQVAAERLATGRRINQARDDAAGAGISDRLTTRIQGIGKTIQNLRDGSSYTGLADGALREVSASIQRLRELAVQSANGVLDGNQRAALNAEFQQQLLQIDQIARQTKLFGEFPLLGASGAVPTVNDLFPNGSGSNTGPQPSGLKTVFEVPVGAQNLTINFNSYGADDDLQVFATDGTHLAGTDLTDYVWQNANGVTPANIKERFLTVANGFDASAAYDGSQLNSGGATHEPNGPGNASSYNGMNIRFGGDGDRTNPAETTQNDGSISASSREYLNIDNVTERLLIFSVGRGAWEAVGSWDQMPSASIASSGDGIRILAEETPRGDDSYITIPKFPSDLVALQLSEARIDPIEDAEVSLDRLDAALERIAGYLGVVGAKASVLETAANAQQNNQLAAEATRSRILDADFAAESLALAKSEILQESANAILTQAAKSQPQLVLQLLQESVGA